MPFHPFQWQGGASWEFDIDLDVKHPRVELLQADAERFVILRSFCYLVPEPDPDAGTVYVVPGADGPVDDEGWPITWSDTKQTNWNGHQVVIPPNPQGGVTDLASVPWFMWWLVATYGNHTRAVLRHDALVVDAGPPPVARKAADRLLLRALREPEQRTGVFRHWLMWAAVAAFGTMGKVRRLLFGASVILLWTLLVTAVVQAWGTTMWSWGPSLWPDGWISPGPHGLWNALGMAIGAFVAIGLLLWALGGAWRTGADNTRGWIAPLAAVAALILILWGLEGAKLAWELSPSNLLLGGLVLLVLGAFWGLAVDKSLRGWLWPTAIIGLPIALLPVGLIFAAVYLVKFIDTGAARVRARQRGEVYVKPEVRPTRLPI